MSAAVSTSARVPYGLARVCRVWAVPRSSVYDRRNAASRPPNAPRKRGPVGAATDDELVEHIQRILRRTPWVGEGYRKVWARLRQDGIRTAKERVRRLMKEHGLRATAPGTRERGPTVHDGTIIPDRPDRRWGIDATSTLTAEGNATIFILVDHCTGECLGIHAARRGTRFEALEPVRQAVRSSFGAFAEGIAASSRLELRHDHGSQFISRSFQDELRLLGIASSPSFVRTPEGNGCAERFIRTLKEQLLWLERFDTVAELLAALHRFKTRFNESWLVQRHGYRTPSEHRRSLMHSARAAAAA